MEILLCIAFLIFLFIIVNGVPEPKLDDDYPEDFHNDDCLFEVKDKEEEEK